LHTYTSRADAGRRRWNATQLRLTLPRCREGTAVKSYDSDGLSAEAAQPNRHQPWLNRPRAPSRTVYVDMCAGAGGPLRAAVSPVCPLHSNCPKNTPHVRTRVIRKDQRYPASQAVCAMILITIPQYCRHHAPLAALSASPHDPPPLTHDHTTTSEAVSSRRFFLMVVAAKSCWQKAR
jgi:hypothetical protein